MNAFSNYTAHAQEAIDLMSAANLILWDAEVNQPKASGPDWDRIQALLQTRAMEIFNDPFLPEELERINASELDPNQQKLLEQLKTIHQRTKKIPASLVFDWVQTTSEAKRVWLEAKKTSDFNMFLPHLKRVIDLAKEKADLYGYEESPYDALTQDFEPGMTLRQAKEILLPLRKPLSNLVKEFAIEPQDNKRLEWFDEQKQMNLSRHVVNLMGMDPKRTRIDKVSGHPMTIMLAPDDIRCTTRINPNALGEGLFASMHEAGHVLQYQGADPILAKLLPVMDTCVSMGIHESQSRFWENMIGKTNTFWRFFLPRAECLLYPELNVTINELMAAINAVKPSFIRIEADETTYNLHILLRMELEEGLLSGELDPKDLPKAWNAKMEEYLGIVPPNDAQGCLQDVHWSLGLFGYFPSYALGTFLSAQLWEKMTRDISSLGDHLLDGNLWVILNWLKTKIHAWGSAHTLSDLTEKVTGEPLNSNIWLNYIRRKNQQG